MTTGEYLVANSPLPSGTALAHFLALQFGAGQGETVFASKFCVVSTDDVQRVSGHGASTESISIVRERELATVGDDVSVFLEDRSVFCTSTASRVFVSSVSDTAVIKSEFDTGEFKINH